MLLRALNAPLISPGSASGISSTYNSGASPYVENCESYAATLEWLSYEEGCTAHVVDDTNCDFTYRFKDNKNNYHSYTIDFITPIAASERTNKFDNVGITGEIYPTNSSESTNIESSKNVDTIKNKTFILRSEISEDGPLYEVHMIDMLNNLCEYFDFLGKYKSTLINIVNKSNEDVSVEDELCPWIFESSYLGTFSKYMLRKIEKYYKQGREVYLYNPVTSYVKCICDGETNIAGLPEFDIEDYGFRLETDVERALLNKSKR